MGDAVAGEHRGKADLPDPRTLGGVGDAYTDQVLAADLAAVNSKIGAGAVLDAGTVVDVVDSSFATGSFAGGNLEEILAKAPNLVASLLEEGQAALAPVADGLNHFSCGFVPILG
jgi:hypothetical protein